MVVKRNRKSECTPEEWAAYLEYSRQLRLKDPEEFRKKRREYTARPEVKAARIARDSTPEGLAKRREKDKRGHAKNWQKVKNTPELHARHKENMRKYRTGFSQSDVDRLYEIQKGKCAICEDSIEGRKMRADHCHDTSTPRGLLCHACNIVEGLLRRKNISPKEYGEKLDNYLKHPPYLHLRL